VCRINTLSMRCLWDKVSSCIQFKVKKRNQIVAQFTNLFLRFSWIKWGNKLGQHEIWLLEIIWALSQFSVLICIGVCINKTLFYEFLFDMWHEMLLLHRQLTRFLDLNAVISDLWHFPPLAYLYGEYSHSFW